MSAVIDKRRLGKRPTSVTLSWHLFNQFRREVYTSTVLYHGWNFHVPTKKPQFQGLTINVAKKFSFKGFRINCERPPKYGFRIGRTVMDTRAIAMIDFGPLGMIIGKPQTSGAFQSPVSFPPSIAAPPKSQSTPVP